MHGLMGIARQTSLMNAILDVLRAVTRFAYKPSRKDTVNLQHQVVELFVDASAG